MLLAGDRRKMKNSIIGFQEKEHGASFKKKEQLGLNDCLRKFGVVYVTIVCSF